MKYTFLIPVFLALPSMAQIDYSAHPETISSTNRAVRVDWLRSTPRNCKIDFNHLVNFINVNNDQTYNSKVNVELYHNNNMIKIFTFPTGDQIGNRIYVGEAINLKKGDKVYFLFKLVPTTHNEEYVFNIYEEPRAAIKTVSVVRPQSVYTYPAPNETKTKHKRHSIPWIGRNVFHIQESIGYEANGIIQY
jgi:hypothetical protein